MPCVYGPNDREPITCASDEQKRRGVRSGFTEGTNTGRSCQSSFYYCYYCCAPGSSNRTSFIDRNARRLLLYIVPAVSAVGPELLVPRLDIWPPFFSFFSPFFRPSDVSPGQANLCGRNSAETRRI